LRASNLVGNTNNPVDNRHARVSGVTAYSTVDPTANLNAGDVVVSAAGGSQAVSKTSPALTMNYCIALQGVFPPRP
jgi:microcystin-dependent protein